MQAKGTGTHEVKDEGAVTGKVGDEPPVRLVHAHVVAVGRVGVVGEAPLESDDDEDGEEEAERADEHGARQAGPRDEGRVGLGRAAVELGRRGGRGDVPQRGDERTAEEDEEEDPSEVGRAAKEGATEVSNGRRSQGRGKTHRTM